MATMLLTIVENYAEGRVGRLLDEDSLPQNPVPAPPPP